MAEVIVIGKSEKGKVIHAITSVGGKQKVNHAACDKRQMGMIIDAKMDVTDITCSKCLQRAGVKGALASMMDSSGKEQAGKTSGFKTADPKKISKKKKRGGEKKGNAEILEESKKKQSKEPTIKATKDDLSEPDGDFFARLKTDGRYKIYHMPTGKVFFDSIPEEVAIDSICNLNAIPEKWPNTNAPLPDNYISNCRKAIREAYSKNNQTIPDTLRDEEGKKKKKKKKKVAPASKTEKLKKGDKMLAVIDGKEVLMVHDGKKFVAVKKERKDQNSRKEDNKENRVIIILGDVKET